MYTTIKISYELKKVLDRMKFVEGETYEQVIEDFVEDHLELNPEFEKEIKEALKECREGKTVPFEKIKSKLKK
ncbi:MAG: hypothetical protein ACPL06_02975 [Candidatus Anstonellales archaeon]